MRPIGKGIAALAVLLLAAVPAGARDNWRRIGDVHYEAPFQQAHIDVGKDDGRFEALSLDVRGYDVEIKALRIVYGNGETDDVPVGDVFRAGATSRPIALKRGSRFVTSVIVTYRAFGPAQFALLGDMADQPPPVATGWEQLGCKPVDFGIDRDVIQVGRAEGVYSKLRLTVEDNPVEFYEVRVVYGNGQQDAVPVHAVITPQQQTQPLDLSGRSRGIDRIEVVYRSMNQQRGQARVCALGLRTGDTPAHPG